MDRIFNYIRGEVRVRVSTDHPERFINMCTKRNINFQNMHRDGDDIVFVVDISDYRYLKSIESKFGFTITDTKKLGTSVFLWRMRKRYALLIGLGLFLALAWFSSLYVWEIRVVGNEKVPTSEILNELEEIGVGIGSNRLTFSQDYISNEMLLRVPELSWITVNPHGSRADVFVREEIEAPEMIDKGTPTVVIAKKSGIIEKMIVYQGKKLTDKGETVRAGDVLVTGEMESMSTGTRYVHAWGDIYARTWYTFSAQLEENANEKQYTGKTVKKYALRFGKQRLNLYLSADSKLENVEKSINENRISFFGITLPLTVVETVFTEYDMKSVKQSDAEKQIEARLTEKIRREIGDGEIVWTEFTRENRDGKVLVTVNCECIEKIGQEEQIFPEENEESEERAVIVLEKNREF